MAPLSRLRVWWHSRRRSPPRWEPCDMCEKVGPGNVTLTSSEPWSEGGMSGGTAISATFCPDHLPDGP